MIYLMNGSFAIKIVQEFCEIPLVILDEHINLDKIEMKLFFILIVETNATCGEFHIFHEAYNLKKIVKNPRYGQYFRSNITFSC